MRLAPSGDDDALRWNVLGARTVHDGHGVRVELVEVTPPARPAVELPVVRLPRVALGVVLDEHERVLLRRVHRFVPDTVGWELPAGELEPDEHAAATAVRAVITETGWRPASPMVHLVTSHPSGGNTDRPYDLFLAEGAEFVGTGTEPQPTVAWVTLATVPELVAEGQITDSGSLVGLLYTLALRSKRA